MPTKIIGNIHDKTDKGKVFLVSNTYTAIANDATAYIRHISGSKYLHSLLSIETVGKWEFTSYAGTTYIADGTEIEPIKRKTDSPIELLSTFYHTPTVDVLGSPRLEYTFGSGTIPSRVSTGQISGDLESIFAPEVDVLVGVTNRSGATQYINFIFNVYEESK